MNQVVDCSTNVVLHRKACHRESKTRLRSRYEVLSSVHDGDSVDQQLFKTTAGDNPYRYSIGLKPTSYWQQIVL